MKHLDMQYVHYIIIVSAAKEEVLIRLSVCLVLKFPSISRCALSYTRIYACTVLLKMIINILVPSYISLTCKHYSEVAIQILNAQT